MSFIGHIFRDASASNKKPIKNCPSFRWLPCLTKLVRRHDLQKMMTCENRWLVLFSQSRPWPGWILWAINTARSPLDSEVSKNHKRLTTRYLFHYFLPSPSVFRVHCQSQIMDLQRQTYNVARERRRARYKETRFQPEAHQEDDDDIRDKYMCTDKSRLTS